MTIKYEPEKVVPKVIKMVEYGQLPQHLYCYMSISKMERIEDMFHNCHLWFSAPTAFNDPFDCKVYPEIPSNEDLAYYLCENAGNVYPDDYETIRQGLERQDKIGVNLAIKAIDQVINQSGIKCFTDRNDCILMWSHYADSHKGICLKFDVLKDPSFFVYPLKMDYRNDYPKINFTDKKFTTTLLRTKFSDWSYEHEYRIYKQAFGYYDFYPKALRSIIFGCSINEKELFDIIDIVRQNKELSHVEFQKADINSTSFKLDIGNLSL